jgi:methyl-accepting chemotaxis protein
MKMSSKIYCVVGLLVAVAIALSVIGIQMLAGMNGRLNDIVNTSAEKVKLGARINQDLLAVSRAEKNIILARNQETMDDFSAFTKKTRTGMQERLERLRGLLDEQGKQALDRFAVTWEGYLTVNQEVRELARLNSNTKARALSGGEGRRTFDRLEKALRAIAEKNERDFQAAGKNRNPVALAESGERVRVSSHLLRNAVEFQRAEKNLILAANQQEMDGYAKAMEKVDREIGSRFNELDQLVDQAGRVELQAAREAYAAYREINEQVRELSRENGNKRAFELASGKGRALADEAEGYIAKIVEQNEQDMARDAELSDQHYGQARTTMILIGLIGILGTLALSVLILRGVNRNLNQIIEGLSEGSDQVAAASGQVSAASQSLAEGASEQAASLEETSSSLEEISSMTKQNAQHAGQANSLMEDAKEAVGSANTSMTEMVSSMQEITKSSEETSKIIKTIDEIAFQTNLLALNAAVEAARAGEAGAGFAVVADEVRNLALRAAEAAKNTASLIEDTTQKVEDGSGLVEKTNQEFGRVEKSAMKVAELVSEIAAASKEQSEGIDQVNQAVADMDKVTQQNAANAEESASSSEELNAQAEQMKGAVETLLVLVDGSGAGLKSTAGGFGAETRRGLPERPEGEATKDGKASALPVKKHGEVRPDQVIPVEDETDFRDI